MQRASCAPQLEQDWCGRLLKKKLEFGQGTPLLSTTGADWDYCGKEELVEATQASVEKLHDAKGHGPDKQAHPVFIAFAGPGQDKSRLLTQFPGLVAECLKDLTNRNFSDEPLAFLLTCENGMGPGVWVTQELNAARFVACRICEGPTSRSSTTQAPPPTSQNFGLGVPLTSLQKMSLQQCWQERRWSVPQW